MAMTDSKDRARVLVAGCGKLGGAIASLLTADATVFGLRRRTNLLADDIRPVSADLTDPASLTDSLPDDLDIVIYCLTPSRYDDQGYHDAYVRGLKNLLAALSGQPVKRLIFISSTGVYSQDDDSWVNESSPTQPARFSGEQILAGETLALNSQFPATVIRFSGIYGPSRRRFLQEVIEGRMNPHSPAPYSNRIHEEDAAAAVHHLATRALEGDTLADCYIGTDCEPVRLDDVVNWVREQIPCASPVEGARTGGRAGSKRCCNQRLLDSGFTFRYPDFRSGYRAMIDETGQQ
ncbi:Nucleoside-diphosphate-sugar epimerase [Marinobacter nitratireducens]|uniref:Nucleoside-diphosphate-sugar epimerase n=1 Tax=Marinobacter nitratireducens TaxID=1137280 RepID=A0A072MZ67_9GAMM|nr:NAD-dependent epimerase/dehydratase family protein [Marinobacter nitratireducens]KEF30297.1 Nucleoside-diphosphate-sugar epimerase [Marinobacter nitratireducens]